MSTAQRVRDRIDASPERSFVTALTTDGPRRAVESELSRLAQRGDLLRVRRGLYWKGTPTRFGVAPPRPVEIALEVAGPGSGPARLSAVSHLGLTTQVPSIDTIAVPGRVPTPPDAIHFVARSIERRIHDLSPTEVAVLEVLRDGPGLLESPWASFLDLIAELVDAARLRPDVILDQLEHEHHVAARTRWRLVADSLDK